MRLAVVGTGISGLVSAHLLAADHDVVVFEQADTIGGHTHTVTVPSGARVDTGFIVFNEWTYPSFVRLLERLGVASQPSNMSFGVRDEARDLEYSATSLSALFATRRNWVRPQHYRMLLDLFRFSRRAPQVLHDDGDDLSLGEFLEREGFGKELVEHFVIPMSAAIWSADRREVLAGPARFFVRFFVNHGMLNLVHQPTWRVVCGGSASYLGPLTAPFRDRIRVGTPVTAARRQDQGVELTLRGGGRERFDEVILACHSDQALALLADATDAEREVLGAIRYQQNDTVLHTDVSVLPRRKQAWAAWNYHLTGREGGPVAVTYNMNLLQGLSEPETYCVTLNPNRPIDPARVIRRIRCHHPVFTRQAVAAQKQFERISGVRRTHFAGAYWYNGFHEDGVRSALRVARRFGRWLS